MLPPPDRLTRKVRLYDGPFDGKFVYIHRLDGQICVPPTGYVWVVRLWDGLVGCGQYVTTEVEETRRDK